MYSDTRNSYVWLICMLCVCVCCINVIFFFLFHVDSSFYYEHKYVCMFVYEPCGSLMLFRIYLKKKIVWPHFLVYLCIFSVISFMYLFICLFLFLSLSLYHMIWWMCECRSNMETIKIHTIRRWSFFHYFL